MAQSSEISLTRQQQDLVEKLVRSGRFDGVHDVVAASLRLLEEREIQAAAFVADIEAEIDAGVRSGAATPMETAQELLAGFRSGR